MNSKEIIVTGATGYIGRNLIPRLLKKKYKITILVRNKNKLSSFKWFKKINCIKFDFDNCKLNLKKLKKNSILIDLAWNGLPNYYSNIHFKKNVNSHYLFIKKLLKNNIIKDLIVTGTCQEYGMKCGLQKVNSKTTPTTAYGKAKKRLYTKIFRLKKFYNFNFKWLRLYYSYGSWQNKNSIFPKLIFAINNNHKYFKMSKGDQLRDYIPISKMVTKIIKVVQNNKIDGIFNVCSGNPIKLKDLVKKIIKLKKSKIKLIFGYYPYLKYEPKYFWGENNI
jgi:nucleoside-diphosphate-sugar epimerase